jgi:D-alanine-D-alanine ligase
MNIVVLAGGTSTERDISIVTSTMVCKSLRRNGHHVNVIDVFLGSKQYGSSQEFFNDNNDLDALAMQLKEASKDVPALENQRKLEKQGFFGPSVLEYCKAADIVFMGLHGSNGEDGKIQAVFDLMDIKYTGTDYLSSAISMSKELTKKVLVADGIPMPKGIALKKGQPYKKEAIAFPCVVKPCCGGSSVGVSIVQSEDAFQQALEDAFQYENEVLVEEFVNGREFSVAVLDGKALPVIEIEPLDGFYDYKNKYSAGATKETCPANLPKDVSDAMMRWAERCCEIAGVTTYARVDEMLDQNNNIYCLEINTLPGMTATSLIPQEANAVGISYDQLTQMIIEISMKKYN